MNVVERSVRQTDARPIVRLGSVVDEGCLIKSALKSMGETERIRAERFIHKADRERFVLGRALLRTLLLEHYNIPPDMTDIQIDPYGKPHLIERPEVDFSISHSGDYVLVGVGANLQIGIDIEKHKPEIDVEGIGKFVFAPEEMRQLMAERHDGRFARFYRQWTAKEALLKAIGSGFTRDPRDFAIILDATPTLVQIRHAQLTEHQSDWVVEVIGAPAAYSAAIAWRNRQADPPDPVK